MEIIEYNKEKEVLSVRYNTSMVWKYSNVSSGKFREIMEAENPEKYMKDFFHSTDNVVGKLRGDS